MIANWDALPISLELAEVLWTPDRSAFTARRDVHELRFARKRKRLTIELALVRPAPFEHAVSVSAPRDGLRVRAGHDDFDAEVWVEAKPWNAEGTDHLLASEDARAALQRLIAAGGQASASRLTVTLEDPPLEAIKAAVRTLIDLGATIALHAHERRARPEPRRAPSLIDESSETAVDEWAKNRFRLHNPFVSPATIEVDLAAMTLQVPPEAPMPLTTICPLFVRPLQDASTLERQGHDRMPVAICRGRFRSIESVADALARLGVEVLA